MKFSNIFFALLFLSSCIEVGFKSSHPSKGKTLEKIPAEMLAFYTGQKSDSNSINVNGLKIDDYFNNEDLEQSLSENTLLIKWKGKYFLNQKEDNLWHIIMIKPIANNRFETYHIDGSNEKTVELLKGLTKVEEVHDDEGKLEGLIIDSSNKEFAKIVKSGAFEIIDIF